MNPQLFVDVSVVVAPNYQTAVLSIHSESPWLWVEQHSNAVNAERRRGPGTIERGTIHRWSGFQEIDLPPLDIAR